jgi:hypothetical protein
MEENKISKEKPTGYFFFYSISKLTYLHILKKFVYLFLRGESVIINEFTSTLHLIIQDWGTPSEITILVLIIFLMWIIFEKFLTTLLKGVWNENDLEDGISYTKKVKDEKRHIFHIYYGSNLWHGSFLKIFDYISLLLLYEVFAATSYIIDNYRLEKQLNSYEGIALIIVLMLVIATTIQEFQDLSSQDDEIQTFLDPKDKLSHDEFSEENSDMGYL